MVDDVHASLCVVSPLLILVMGCVQDSSFGRANPQSEAGLNDVELSIDIAIQRSQWGDQVGRCHLQAALRTFEPTEEDMVPFTESEGSLVILPETPDTCAHSVLDDPGPPMEPEGEGDNWQIAGEDVAAETIVLVSDRQTIVLEQVRLEGDSIRYEWIDCTEENFPFGQVFDLEMDDDPGLQVPGFVIEEAFAVGPDISFMNMSGQPYFHHQTEDLEVRWTELHDWPSIRGESVDVERILWARNRTMDDPMPFEALACLPSGTNIVVAAEDWSKLEANETQQDRSTLTGLQIDTVATSPPFEAPWGQTISVRSTVSDGGDLHLNRGD